MSRDLEVAKEIVTRFWNSRFDEIGSVDVANEVFRVSHAKPEELVHDYEAIIAILEKALKEIRGELTK